MICNNPFQPNISMLVFLYCSLYIFIGTYKVNCSNNQELPEFEIILVILTTLVLFNLKGALF